MSYFSSGLARIELATRGFGDHRSTSELQPYIFLVQPISLILCLKHDISSKELIFDLALLLRGSLHWEVVCPSNNNLLNWVEVSNPNYYLHVASFIEMNRLVFVSVALSFELSLSSIREMPPVFQCQDFPNFSYLKLCALIERYVIYRNQIFFQGLLITILLFFWFIGFLSIKYDLHKLMHRCLQVLELYQIGQALLSSEMEQYIYYCFVSKVYWKFP